MKKRINGVLISLLLLIAAFGFSIYPQQETVQEKPEAIEKVNIEELSTYVNEIDDYRESFNNNDIVARLVIEDIGIDSMITKTTNNSYYLTHNLAGEDDVLGNPFVDFRNELPLGEERQINIYSHNSDYASYQEELPFYKLEKYLDTETFNNAKDIYLYTDEEALKYQVYAVKIITTSNEHTRLDSKNAETWEKHLNYLVEDTSQCRGKCKLKDTDQLLILQTCNFQPRGSYILVIMKKV